MGNNKNSNCQCSNNDKCTQDCKNSGSKCKKHSDCQSGGAVRYNISYFKSKKFLKGGYLDMNNDLSKWESLDAKKYYKEVVKIYGEPDIKVNKPKGICIWYNNDENKLSPHVKIELKDESVDHCVPATHIDFLYSFVKIYIPEDKIIDVLSVSGSVNYDPLKKELFARCGSFAANYATLKTVIDKIMNVKTDYSNNIKNKDKEIKKNKEIVIKFLEKNNELYEKEMKKPYHPLAFPKGCPNIK